MVDAGIDALWDVVRDPTRVGEWSHECVDGEWVGEATEARPGARFRGKNEQGIFRWGRLCEVVSAEPYELVWRTVPTRLYPDSTEWAIRLAPVDRGTRIEQTFQVVARTMLEPLYATILPAHRDRTDALRQDLERIGTLGPNRWSRWSRRSRRGSAGRPAIARCRLILRWTPRTGRPPRPSAPSSRPETRGRAVPVA